MPKITKKTSIDLDTTPRRSPRGHPAESTPATADPRSIPSPLKRTPSANKSKKMSKDQSQGAPHLWLRAETKKNERRTAITPNAAKKLIEQGFKITVEASTDRIFPDSDYSDIGLPIVPAGTWKSEADCPKDAIVIGLKELPENDDSALTHSHIMFAHCFKNQGGWKDVLNRFKRGDGKLYDLEFLNDERGRRVAAFGYYAGFAGSAVGIDVWAHNNTVGGEYPKINPFGHEDDLIAYVRARVEAAVLKIGRQPTIMVMGAKGRCGTGAVDFAKRIGIPESNILQWDMAETARGGPFVEIVQQDIFINCIYLSSPIPPFLSPEQLKDASRQLTVLCDVSCDTTNPHNPIPVYSEATTFDLPVLSVLHPQSAPLDVIAIDHLPTLLPRESSEAFCTDLLPSLLQLKEVASARVWTDALDLFHKKMEAAHA